MSIFQTPAPDIELVKIPAGEFVMGIDANDSPESPAHKVNLAEYYIGKYPVTNEQYLNFVLDTGHYAPCTWQNGSFPKNRANHPVGGITWADADLFCAWLRYKTGKPFHLPTEAQWEKAATWDPQKNRKTHFPWGNQYQQGQCNLMGSASSQSQPPSIAHGLIAHGPMVNLNMHIANDEVGTTPVGYYSPAGDSIYGCADMIGNVEEWCNSAMWNYPYQPDDGREESFASGQRCIRGGDWYTFIPQSGLRRSSPSDAWYPLWGLRVAMSPAVEKARHAFRQGLDAEINATRKHFQEILLGDPNSPQLYYDWGSRLISILNYGIDQYSAEMEASFTKAIELFEKSKTAIFKRSPKHPLTTPPGYLYFNRALVRGKSNDYNGAFEDMTCALKLDEKDPDAYLMRAEYACEIKKYAQMEQDMQKSQQLNTKPSFRKSVLTARLLETKGEWGKANQAYTELMMGNLFTHLPFQKMVLWRATTYQKLGMQESAICDYYRYFLLHPEDTRVAATVQRAQQWVTQNREQ